MITSKLHVVENDDVDDNADIVVNGTVKSGVHPVTYPDIRSHEYINLPACVMAQEYKHSFDNLHI